MQAHLGLSVVSHTVESCCRFTRLVISGAIPYGWALVMRIHRPMMSVACLDRSEERRVGKECRSRCDWSSDACSSYLVLLPLHPPRNLRGDTIRLGAGDEHQSPDDVSGLLRQIGRAACRERVQISV